MAAIVPVSVPAVAEYNDIADCLICCQTYNITNRAPVVLSCGHTFCRNCVEKVIINHVCKCFECRSATNTRNKGLAVNITLIRTLESFKVLKNDNVVMAQKEKKADTHENAQSTFANNIASQFIERIVSEGDDHHALNAARETLAEVHSALRNYSQIVYDRLLDDDNVEENEANNNVIRDEASNEGINRVVTRNAAHEQNLQSNGLLSNEYIYSPRNAQWLFFICLNVLVFLIFLSMIAVPIFLGRRS